MLDGHAGSAIKVLVAIHYSQKWIHKKCSDSMSKVIHLQRLPEPGN